MKLFILKSTLFLLVICFNPFITYGQNVGIGHTLPTELLHVKNGNVYIESGELILKKTGSLAFDSRIYMEGDSLKIKGSEDVIISSAPNSNVFISNFNGNYVEFNGTTSFVGIGKTPVYELDVAGTLRADAFIMPTGAVSGHVLTTGNNGAAYWAAPSSDTDWLTGSDHVYNLSDRVAIGNALSSATLGVYNTQGKETMKSLYIQTIKDIDTTATIQSLEISSVQYGNSPIEGLRTAITRAAGTTGSTQGSTLNLTGYSSNQYMEGSRTYVNRLTGNPSSVSPICAVHSISIAKDGASAVYGSRYLVCNDGSGGASYGVYSSYSNNCSTPTNYYSGFFVGDVYSTGAYLPSDAQLKHKVRPVSSSLNKLMNLEVKKYHYNTTQFARMNLPSGEQTGFLAQELEQVFPGLVKKHIQPGNAIKEDAEFYGLEDDLEYKGVNYTGLIPHTVKAIQEQQQTIESLEKRLADQELLIKKMLEKLEGK